MGGGGGARRSATPTSYQAKKGSPPKHSLRPASHAARPSPSTSTPPPSAVASPPSVFCCCRRCSPSQDHEGLRTGVPQQPLKPRAGVYAVLLGTLSLSSLLAAMTTDLWAQTHESVRQAPTLPAADAATGPGGFSGLSGIGSIATYSDVVFDVGLWRVCSSSYKQGNRFDGEQEMSFLFVI